MRLSDRKLARRALLVLGVVLLLAGCAGNADDKNRGGFYGGVSGGMTISHER